MAGRKGRTKIVLIGGGSANWTPHLGRDLMLTESLREAELVLYDTDPAAARLLAAFLDRVRDAIQSRNVITPSSDRAAAFKNADYFIITISTGGLDAMRHDLAIPARFGILHTVGDTSGPGGWARSLRNAGVFMELGRAITRLAPRSIILNYTNPMTVLTGILAGTAEVPVVGLCHGLFENLEILKSHYKLKSTADLSVRYAGLNHFFWMTDIRIRGFDALADLRRQASRKGLSAVVSAAYADTFGHRSDREVASELFRLTGVLPYLGDRHTSEFFPHYITRPASLRQYRLLRTSVAERRRKLAAARARLRAALRARVLAPVHLKRSRETAADIINAHLTGQPFIDVGNLPNRGQISELPAGTVVETPVRVDSGGFTPLVCDELPAPVSGWLRTYAEVFNMTEEAALLGSRDLAVRALRLDPVCAHLDGRRLEELAGRLLKAHRRFIPWA